MQGLIVENISNLYKIKVQNKIYEANARGTTVVVVTHNKDIVNAMQKRVITMKKGVIIADQKQGGYIDEN